MKVKVQVAQSCPALCNCMHYTVPGILHARLLEWLAVPFPRGSFQPRDWTQVSLIAGGFFTSWAPREAVVCYSHALSVFWKCSVVTTPLYCLMKKHWPIHSILEERKNIVSYILFNVWKREPEKWKCELLCHVWLSVTPMDCYLPGSSIHEIFQARIQEWVSILFSRESSQFRDHTWVPHNAGRFVTIWATKNYYM